QTYRAVVPMAVVVECVLAGTNRLGELTIVDESGGGPTALERERVQQRVHCGSGVSRRECRVLPSFGRLGSVARALAPDARPRQNLIALMIDDDERPIVYMSTRQAGERSVQYLLCGNLNVRVKRGLHLGLHRPAMRQTQHMADKMAGFNRSG